MESRPLISICCITYNHGKFIRKALDGMLKQEITYDYEILIHDDASTDDAPEIIKEYAELYPNKIFPILQKENKYSQGVSVNYTYNYLRARGKYLALCEGDDYWVDKHKLQKQVEYMELHSDCMISFHNAIVVDVQGSNIQDFLSEKRNCFNRFKHGTKVYLTKEMIVLGFVPTASLVLRKEAIIPPAQYYFNKTCGDLPLCLMAASKGNAYFIDEKMSAYRRGNPLSASGRAIANQENINKYIDGVINIYKAFDEDTNYLYHDACNYRIKAKHFEKHMLTNNLSQMKSKEYEEYYSRLGYRQKISFVIKSKSPLAYKIIKNLMKK